MLFRSRIKAADLGGLAEAAELSPEEEELQAEMAEMTSGGPTGPNPGEPQFTYVAIVAAEERARATAGAFQKAKADAERLATAAGAKIVKLVSLHDNAQTAGLEDGSSAYGLNPYYGEVLGRQMQMMQASTRQGEADQAVGVRPGKVKFTVQVTAYFEVE